MPRNRRNKPLTKSAGSGNKPCQDEKSPSEVISLPDSKQEEFNKEVNWCVDQLRMGLLTKKPNEKQVKECERVLKVLTSKKAPLVKKRQAMKLTFGDYRKKIEVEESKWEKDTLKRVQASGISLVYPEAGKVRFIKKSHRSSVNVSDTLSEDAKLTSNDRESVDINCVSDKDNGGALRDYIQEDIVQQFKFNFTIDDS